MTSSIALNATNACILCIDDKEGRAKSRRKKLEDIGFAVMDASDESQAVGLLVSRRVNVVCVHAHSLKADMTRMGAKIKSLRPNIRFVLICEDGVVPASFLEYVDVVMDESDFNKRAKWLIDELLDVRCPVFVKWFDDWKRRTAEQVNNPVSS